HMVAAGVRFVSPPREEPYGRLAVFLDLEGNRWDLLGRDPRGERIDRELPSSPLESNCALGENLRASRTSVLRPQEGAMRFPAALWLLGAALRGALDSTGHAQAPTPPPPRTPRTVPNFVMVTDQIIRAPKPEDWLIHRGNYQAWGYSPLDQINKNNVKNLQLAWSRVMEPGINQMTPLVYNGVMYLGNPGDVIQAIDAAK